MVDRLTVEEYAPLRHPGEAGVQSRNRVKSLDAGFRGMTALTHMKSFLEEEVL
jgi:hypothetical protein